MVVLTVLVFVIKLYLFVPNILSLTSGQTTPEMSSSVTSFNSTISPRRIKIAIIIAYNDSRLFSVRKIRPSIEIAIRQVHARKILSNDVQLDVSYSDSHCNSMAAPVAAFNFIMENNVDVFFGPVCDYSLAPVARYAPYWNKPVISPGGFAHDFGADKSAPEAEFPTLTRMGVTFNTLAFGIISSIIHFNWTKIMLVYDTEGHNDITPRFCYLAGSALIYYVKTYERVQFEHDQFLMLPDTDIERMLQEKVGNDFSSKFCASPFYCISALLCPWLAGRNKITMRIS